MNFGEKLTKLRKDKGLSQEELAQELNVSRQAVSKWESNSSYPETDKIIQICKIFNISMDEVIGLKESKEKNTKNHFETFNKFTNEFISGIKMFYKMTFKQKLKCLFEMFFYFCIITILFIIIYFALDAIIYNVLSILPYRIFSSVNNILEGLSVLIYFVITSYLLIKLYKIRYLDYYEESENKVEYKCDNEPIVLNKKEEKIIIRDSKNDFNPFSWFKMICKILLKMFLFFLTLPVAIIFVILIACIIFIIYYINNGVILLYVVLGLLGFLLLSYLFLEIFIKLIFDMDLKPKKLLIITIISLILIGLNSGLFVGELSKFKITYNKTYSEKVKEEIIPYEENMIIEYLFHNNTSIVYEDRDDILVEFYVNNSKFIDVSTYKYRDNYYNRKLFTIYDYEINNKINNLSLNDIINLFLNNIKNKNIVLYDDYAKIVIHISEDNYNTIINNAKIYNTYE